MKTIRLQSMWRSALVLPLACATCGFAQIAPGEPVEPASTSDSASPSVPAYLPLTLGDKYAYSLHKVFGPGQILSLGFRAGLGEMIGRPVYWGSGAEGFGVRMASHFGISLLHQTIAFGVRAADHEDPRYFRLGQGTISTRVKYAMVHTFLVRKDDGGYIPAYSRFISDYAVPFIAREWRPLEYQGTGQALRAGTISLGVATCTNLSREFLPDLRKKFLKR